jgi:subtilisin family serine protease
MTVRPPSPVRRLSRTAAAGAFALAATCSGDTDLTSPGDETSVLLNAADAMAAVQAGPPESVAGEVLVKFRSGAEGAGLNRAVSKVAGQALERISTAAMKGRDGDEAVMRLRVGRGVPEAIAELRADPDVEYAELNWVYRHSSSNDTYDTNGSLWGMYSGTTIPRNAFGSCYPAAYPNANILAVASITRTGALSAFSTYGSTTIDIGAPGGGIWSTVPASSRGRIVSSYASYNGTSMATPHVAGAAALYAARNPGATAAQIRSAILICATATSSLSGLEVTNGRLNVSGF